MLDTRTGFVKTCVPNVVVRFVSLHGGIGAGKTTLLERLELRGFRVLYEDIDSWRNMKGFNVLDEYYKNPSRYAYCFQSEIIRSRYLQFEKILNDREWLLTDGPDTIHVCDARIKVVFCERDEHSSLEVFARRLLEQGLMNELEIQHMYRWAETLRFPPVVNVVYLAIPAEVCLQRCALRNRSEEKSVDRKLIEDIERLYETWIRRVENSIKIVRIPPFDLDRIEQVVDRILNFFLH